MDELDYAYLAGLIDGEGALDLGVYLRTSSYKGKQYQAIGCSPKLVITLKLHPINEYVISWLHNTFGGNVSRRKRLMWMITGSALEDVLRKVLPYLKIKREEACILLEALELIRKKQGYWNFETIKQLASLQDRLFNIRLKNRGHLRKWTGEKIIKKFEEIAEERQRKGHRTGVLKPRFCLNCGKRLTKEQIWTGNKFCSHKCYITYRRKHPEAYKHERKYPEVPKLRHEYVLICRKPDFSKVGA